MKHRLTNLVLAASCVVGMQATVLSPDQALEMALGQRQTTTARRAPSRQTAELTATINTRSGEPGVYVFNRGDKAGFYVVAADDACGDVLLGYSDTGSLNPALNPQLQYWLGEYADEIEFARQHPQSANVSPRPRRAAANRAAIAPMLTTLWDQSAPFKNDCPIINGERAVTGCAATAMAQVLKHYNYPADGTGTVEYVATTTQTYTLDGHPFDWTNMVNVYNDESTEAQNAAVANLMFACGASIHSTYSLTETSGPANRIVPALINNFSYDNSAQYVYRNYYESAQWEDLIYNSLSNYGPVLYGGSNSGGGHEFVVDGYDGDGMFHVNWGWAGRADGFFRLNALTPSTSGIGGNTLGYNTDQSAVINIRRPVSGSVAPQSIVMYGELGTTTTGTVAAGGTFSISGEPMNMSSVNLANITLGLKFVSSTGVESYSASGTNVATLNSILSNGKGQRYQGNYTCTLPTGGLADGSYTAYPAWKDASGVWHDILCKRSGALGFNVTVNNGNATISTIADQLITSTINLLTPLSLNEPFLTSITLTNETQKDFEGAVSVGLFDANGALVGKGKKWSQNAYGITSYEDIQASVNVGETVTLDSLSLRFQPQSGALAAGAYQIALIDAAENLIGQKQDVELVEPKGTISNLRFIETSTDQIVAQVTVACTQGYITNNVTIDFRAKGGVGKRLGYIESEPLALRAGETQTLTIAGTFTAGELGTTYTADVNTIDADVFTYSYTTANFTITYPTATLTATPSPASGSKMKSLQAFSLNFNGLTGSKPTLQYQINNELSYTIKHDGVVNHDHNLTAVAANDMSVISVNPAITEVGTWEISFVKGAFTATLNEHPGASEPISFTYTILPPVTAAVTPASGTSMETPFDSLSVSFTGLSGTDLALQQKLADNSAAYTVTKGGVAQAGYTINAVAEDLTATLTITPAIEEAGEWAIAFKQGAFTTTGGDGNNESDAFNVTYTLTTPPPPPAEKSVTGDPVDGATVTNPFSTFALTFAGLTGNSVDYSETAYDFNTDSYSSTYSVKKDGQDMSGYTVKAESYDGFTANMKIEPEITDAGSWEISFVNETFGGVERENETIVSYDFDPYPAFSVTYVVPEVQGGGGDTPNPPSQDEGTVVAGNYTIHYEPNVADELSSATFTVSGLKGGIYCNEGGTWTPLGNDVPTYSMTKDGQPFTPGQLTFSLKSDGGDYVTMIFSPALQPGTYEIAFGNWFFSDYDYNGIFPAFTETSISPFTLTYHVTTGGSSQPTEITNSASVTTQADISTGVIAGEAHMFMFTINNLGTQPIGIINYSLQTKLQTETEYTTVSNTVQLSNAIAPEASGELGVNWTPASNGTYDVIFTVNKVGPDIAGTKNNMNTADNHATSFTVVVTDTGSGINGVMVDEPGVEWYDLQGQRVQHPGHGVFIKVKDGRAEKIKI